MVQIFINISKDENVEWGMVEFQGALESKDNIDFNGLYTGDLHFDEKGTPYMIIGHHLLAGKIVDLNKPFAVMRRSANSKVSKCKKDEMDAIKDTDSKEKIVDHYDIVALIKRKIIFKNRPRPIITSSNLIRR